MTQELRTRLRDQGDNLEIIVREIYESSFRDGLDLLYED
jgi:hypothetical protein